MMRFLPLTMGLQLLLCWMVVAPSMLLLVGAKNHQHDDEDDDNLNPLVHLRLMSYNLRFATKTPTPHEEFWPVRAPLMLSQLHFETIGRPQSLLCFQEALAEQVMDLQKGLGEDQWSYVGVGRDDGEWGGEFSPIFYQPSIWDLQANDTYWLSETPRAVGSIGWDAHLPRIVTVAKLQHRQTQLNIVYTCTHFASNTIKGNKTGEVARQESAKLLVRIADEWSDNDSNLVFMAGDLNSEPNSVAHQILAEQEHDTRSLVPTAYHHGNHLSYTSFDEPEHPPALIDYIFVKDTKGLDFLSHAIPSNRYDNNIFISDHCPVIVDVLVNKQGMLRYSSKLNRLNEEKAKIY